MSMNIIITITTSARRGCRPLWATGNDDSTMMIRWHHHRRAALLWAVTMIQRTRAVDRVSTSARSRVCLARSRIASIAFLRLSTPLAPADARVIGDCRVSPQSDTPRSRPAIVDVVKATSTSRGKPRHVHTDDGGDGDGRHHSSGARKCSTRSRVGAAQRSLCV